MSAYPRAATLAGYALVLGLLALSAGPARAQTAASTLQAGVIIEPPSIAGAGIQSLGFGALAIGAVGDAPPGAAAPGATVSSAGWRFSGIGKRSELALSLDLPAGLTRGASSIPLEWDNGGYGHACVGQPGGGCLLEVSFNPAADAGVSIIAVPPNLPGNDLDLTVYVGARVVVPQVPPGLYTGTITLTVIRLN